MSIVRLIVIGYWCNYLDRQLNYQASAHWLISGTTMYHLCNQWFCHSTLGVKCLQPSLDIWGKSLVSSSCISSSGSVQVSGRTCQRSSQTFYSGGTMLDEGSLDCHSSQHVGRCSSAVPHHKRSHHGCLNRPGAQGSAISALKSLAASSLTTFKLAWKTATLLAPVTTKCCSDLTLLCIDNQDLFFSIMLLFSFPCLVARQIVQVIFLLKFILSLAPMLIFVMLFNWRLIWDILNHLGWSQMDHVWPLFLGNHRQHRPVCAKTISSWVRQVLCVAKAHISPGPLWGAAASAALVAGVSLVSILQAEDLAGVSTLARHYFSPYITTMDWHQDSVQHAMLGLSE